MSKHCFDPLCRSGFDIDASENESNEFEEWLVVLSSQSSSLRAECNVHALVKRLNDRHPFCSTRFYTLSDEIIALVDPGCEEAIKTAQLLVEFIDGGNDLDPAEYLKALNVACQEYWHSTDFSERVHLLMLADGDVGRVVESDPPDVVMPILQERYE